MKPQGRRHFQGGASKHHIRVDGEWMAWNERKNSKEGMGFTDRYSAKEEPDNDFIDIMALAQNITCEFADREDAESWLDRNRQTG